MNQDPILSQEQQPSPAPIPQKHFSFPQVILLAILVVTACLISIYYFRFWPLEKIDPSPITSNNEPVPSVSNNPKLTYKVYLSEGMYRFAIFVDDVNIYEAPNPAVSLQLIKTVNPNIQILYSSLKMYIINLQSKKVLPLAYDILAASPYLNIELSPSWSRDTGKSLHINTSLSAWNKNSAQITGLLLNNKPAIQLDSPINVHQPVEKTLYSPDYEETVNLIPTGINEDLTRLYFSLIVEELQYRKDFSIDIPGNIVRVESNNGILLPTPAIRI